MSEIGAPMHVAKPREPQQPSLLGQLMPASIPEKSAHLSLCGTYRYDLTRYWGPETLPGLSVVMVNPSTADHEVDDPTILRLIGFAKRWGYGGLAVFNLFALRSSDPSALDVHDDPIGPSNRAKLEWVLDLAARNAWPVLCAWGNGGHRRRQAEKFIQNARARGVRLMCLGLTESGAPKHPLARGQHRIPDDFIPIPFGEVE